MVNFFPFVYFVSFVFNDFPFRLPEPNQRRTLNHEKHENHEQKSKPCYHILHIPALDMDQTSNF